MAYYSNTRGEDPASAYYGSSWYNQLGNRYSSGASGTGNYGAGATPSVAVPPGATSVNPMSAYQGTVQGMGTAEEGAPRAYDPAYGGVPNLPRYSTDTQTTMGPDVQAQMIANLPGYQGAVAADMANIQDMLGGNVAGDVYKQIAQQIGELGIGTGTELSPANLTAFMGKFGLTSAYNTQLAHQMLTEAMQRTPIQQMQTQIMTTDLGPQRAVYAAAPEPGAAAAAALANAQQGINAGYGTMPSPRGLGGYTLGASSGTPGYYGAGTSPVAQAGPAQWARSAGGAQYPGMHWDASQGTYVPDATGYGWGAYNTGGDTGYSFTGTPENYAVDASIFGYGIDPASGGWSEDYYGV